MSDGEAFEPEADVVEAARRAADAGITLVAVGFGTTAGATIPERGAGAQTLKRDENGQIVVSRYHPELLQAAARAANGVYIEAAATDKAANMRRALATLRRQGRMAQAGAERRPQFQLFLLPALLFLLADTLLAERRGASTPRAGRGADRRCGGALRRWRSRRALTRPTPRATSCSALVVMRRRPKPIAARSCAATARARTQYNYGTALILAGRADEAVETLERAALSTDLETRYRALFNLGYIFLQRGRSLEGDAVDPGLRGRRRCVQARAARAARRARRQMELRAGAATRARGWRRRRRERDARAHAGRPGVANARAAAAPLGQLVERQAEQILNSAARDEQEVQGRKQRTNQPDVPPRGKDW